MQEQDKKELIFFILQKVFCLGQQAYAMNPIHKELLVMVKLIASNSTLDRHLFVSELGSLFSGRQNVSQTVFSNLIEVANHVYDSYLPGVNCSDGISSVEGVAHPFNLQDLHNLRTITQNYFVQVPQKSGQEASAPLQMTPCLEAQLRTHRIWTYEEVWLGLSKDFEVNTFLGIHFLQDQMASYEVDPTLLLSVTQTLVSEVKAKLAELG